MATCHVCGGSGRCTTCGGSGETKDNSHPSPLYRGNHPGYSLCVACRGNCRCTQCNGTGQTTPRY